MFSLMIKNDRIETTIMYGIHTYDCKMSAEGRRTGAFQTKISIQDEEPEENVPDIIECIQVFTRCLHDYFTQPN